MWSTAKGLFPFGPTLVAAIAAIVGLASYRHQTRTKKAEFLLALHKSFFVEEFYKKVRDQIDGGSAETIKALVEEESSAFTDFLNFFELVAYMGKQKTLSDDDIDALLGYYLRTLRGNTSLKGYIADPKNGFGHLNNLIRGRID